MRLCAALIGAGALLGIWGTGASLAPASAQEGIGKPNIVVIVVDDAALMDFSAYGGEARTPHIDALAARGALFTEYRTSPLCAPSRAMLLTGMDNHRTGVATIPEVLPPEHEGKPGYSMRLEPGVVTIARRLQSAGYRTYLTGKWHLGHDEGDLPIDHGFDRSFLLDASGADNWEDKSYMPYYRDAPWFEGREEAALPEEFYSSEFIVDKMIEYMTGDARSDRPFFAYMAFLAVHVPIQAPKAYTDKYEGVYDDGWEALQARRWARAKELGLVPEDAQPAPFPDGIRAWEDLSAEEQRLFAKSMQVNAGMLEAMDHHIGRYIAHLKEIGAYENTIFVVTSDNGPEPSNPMTVQSFRIWMQFNGYDWNVENLGEKGSYAFIGTEWAAAASAGLNLFKFYASGGGLRVPLIMAGPGVDAGRRVDALSFVTDVKPTLLELAGIEVTPDPEERAMTGRSLAPVLNGAADRVYGETDAVGIEVSGNAALFRGDYKLVRNGPQHGDWQWRLYNVRTDPGETRDLAADLPELYADMQAAYDAYAEEIGVLPMPEGYTYVDQLTTNSLSKQLEFYWWLVGLALLIVLVLIYGLYRATRAVIRRLV